MYSHPRAAAGVLIAQLAHILPSDVLIPLLLGVAVLSSRVYLARTSLPAALASCILALSVAVVCRLVRCRTVCCKRVLRVPFSIDPIDGIAPCVCGVCGACVWGNDAWLQRGDAIDALLMSESLLVLAALVRASVSLVTPYCAHVCIFSLMSESCYILIPIPVQPLALVVLLVGYPLPLKSTPTYLVRHSCIPCVRHLPLAIPVCVTLIPT